MPRDRDTWPDLAGRMAGPEHRLPVRVYYEDTDFSGFVYHANYLKFCERARSDWLRLLGWHHRDLITEEGGGLGFVVRKLQAEFRKPAVIDDVLEVATKIASLTGARLTLEQTVYRGLERLFEMAVTVALVDRSGRPRRVPAELMAVIAPKAVNSG